jgi:hypothetical protein
MRRRAGGPLAHSHFHPKKGGIGPAGNFHIDMPNKQLNFQAAIFAELGV